MSAPAPGGTGVLAIWNDCAPGAEAEYEHWYRNEHLAERIGIEGFIAGWRYFAVDATLTYFTYYETVTPDVLTSPAYLERVNDPTPLTRRIMSGVFTNSSRTICERALRIGDAHGGFVTVSRFRDPQDPEHLTSVLTGLAEDPEVLRAELWVAHPIPPVPASSEQELRGPDATITACLVLASADERAARTIASAARAALSSAADIGVYRLMCSLHRADLARVPSAKA